MLLKAQIMQKSVILFWLLNMTIFYVNISMDSNCKSFLNFVLLIYQLGEISKIRNTGISSLYLAYLVNAQHKN